MPTYALLWTDNYRAYYPSAGGSTLELQWRGRKYSPRHPYKAERRQREGSYIPQHHGLCQRACGDETVTNIPLRLENTLMWT